ncbi:hypothetical protein SALBM217S_04292 [Streptomyces griseoloalbus]
MHAVTVGRLPGGSSAAGARYVLPAVASYATAGAGAPRPGGLALDRGTAPDSLVVHEETAPDEDGPTRLWRYAFGPRPDRARCCVRSRSRRTRRSWRGCAGCWRTGRTGT